MMHIPRKLGLCLVLYDSRHLGLLISRIQHMQRNLGATLDILALIPTSSSLTPSVVRALCESRGVQVVDCRNADDTYFDLSAYLEGSLYFASKGYHGVLYLNDTLITKHDSSHLMAALCNRIEMSKDAHFDFPLLVGPYSKSEFSFGHGPMDEFVPTFLFYLNAAGVRGFVRLLEEMPAIHRAIEHKNSVFFEVDESLLRFCQVHALQLRDRYLINGQVDARLQRKLTTAYCERMLTGRVRTAGLIWYVAGGLFGRLLVPMQVGWSRILRRLGTRVVDPK